MSLKEFKNVESTLDYPDVTLTSKIAEKLLVILQDHLNLYGNTESVPFTSNSRREYAGIVIEGEKAILRKAILKLQDIIHPAKKAKLN
jgi:hypothetical protein